MCAVPNLHDHYERLTFQFYFLGISPTLVFGTPLRYEYFFCLLNAIPRYYHALVLCASISSDLLKESTEYEYGSLKKDY